MTQASVRRLAVRLLGTRVRVGARLEGPAARALSAVRSRSDSLPSTALLSLVALSLVITLIVPGAFLVAKEASVAFDRQLAQHADYSQVRLAQGSGGEDGLTLFSGLKKRLRGILQSKDGLDKVSSFILSLQTLGLRIEGANSSHTPVLVESDPRDGLLPQELLRRPPPPAE